MLEVYHHPGSNSLALLARISGGHDTEWQTDIEKLNDEQFCGN